MMNEDSGSNADWDWNARVSAYNGARYTDIQQANVGNCWLLAAIGAVAQSGVDLTQRITYLGNCNYRVMMFDLNTRLPVYETVRFDGTLAQGLVNGENQQADPFPRVEGESWVIIMQRAMFQRLGINWHDPNAIPAGWSDEPMRLLRGHSTDVRTPPWLGPFWEADRLRIIQALALHKAVVADTRPGAYGTLNALGSVVTRRLVENHAYVVVAIHDQIVTVYNPWGHDNRDGDPVTGDSLDGLVNVSWDDFRRSMGHIYIS